MLQRLGGLARLARGPTAADALHEGQHVRVAPEIGREAYVSLVRQAASLPAKDSHIGAAEAVDRLLSVTHRAEAAVVAADKQPDELQLRGVGVLELVDHHESKASGEIARHLRMVAQGSQGKTYQVVVVKHRTLALKLAEALIGPAGELKSLRCEGRELRERNFGLREGEGGFQRGKQVSDGLRLPRRLDVAQCLLRRLDRLLAGGKRGKALERVKRGADGRGRLRRERAGAQRLELLEQLPHHPAHGITACGPFQRLQAVKGGRASGSDGIKALDQAEGTRLRTTRLLVAFLVIGREELPVAPGCTRSSQDLIYGLEGQLVSAICRAALEGGIEPEIERMAMQDARAHAMDRRYPGAVDLQRGLIHAGVAQSHAHALADLARRRLREGDDKGLAEVVEKGFAPDARPWAQRIDDTPGQGERLAGASTGLDEKWGVKRACDAALRLAQTL